MDKIGAVTSHAVNIAIWLVIPDADNNYILKRHFILFYCKILSYRKSIKASYFV